MSEDELGRVREDLMTIKRALGWDRPFGLEMIWLNLAITALGVVIGVTTLATRISDEPAVRISSEHGAYIALFAVSALLMIGGLALAALRWRSRRQEYGRAFIASVIAVPLFVCFVAGTMQRGFSPGAIVVGVVLSLAIGMLVQAFGDWRAHLGWAIATLLFACWLTAVGTYQQAGTGAGAWLLFGGGSTAALLALRRWKG